MATLNSQKIKSKKKKNITLFLVCTAIDIFLSVWLAYIIHQILTAIPAGQSLSLQLSYPDALYAFATMHKVRVWFLALQLIYMSMVLYSFFHFENQIINVDTIHITDDIEVPVPAGNGQHGNERFLTEQEKADLFQVFEFTGHEKLQGKGGIVVQMERGGRKEKIFYVGKDLHSLIIGASGSGKTRRILLETLWMQIMSGVSVVISDVKGEIFYYTAPYAESMGYCIDVLDFRNPKKSMHLNFLQPILDAFAAGDAAKAIDYTWDLVSVLVGERKGEPLWYNGETATIAAGILAVCLDAPPECRNMANVYYFIANMCESDMMGNMPLNQYLDELDDTHPAKGVFAMAKVAADKTRSSFFTSALGTLRLFTNPNVAEMTSKSDFNLKDIGRKKTIVYMIIPDEKKTLYPLVSILVTQMYSLQVELANECGLRLPVDTDFDLDEVGNFPMIPSLPNIVSAGRSRGVRANLVIQDYQQLEKKYKDDFKNIKTNCQIKIYLKTDDPDTLKAFSDGLGKYTVEVSSASSSASSNGTLGTKDSVSYSSSASLTGRNLLEPAEIKRMKSPYALVTVTGEYPAINKLPDLSQYRANAIYGLGDEAYNNKLVQEREGVREEHEIGELKLWGIWKEYKENSSAPEPQGERISFLDSDV